MGFIGAAVAQNTAADPGRKGPALLQRGEMLATFGGCNDCHTPKLMTLHGPVPDKTRLLSGHPARRDRAESVGRPSRPAN